jgi:methionine-rich copper-binding protein CopC
MKSLVYSAALCLVASSAFAHSELTASMPADKASVETAPKELVLHFSEPVRLTALTITRAGDARRDLKPLPGESLKDFNIASPALLKGQYTVNWRALSGDAHVMTGQFTFAVAEPAAGGAAHDSHAGAHSEQEAQHAKH